MNYFYNTYIVALWRSTIYIPKRNIYIFCQQIIQAQKNILEHHSSWWFQPIFQNISQIESFPWVGMNMKKYVKPPLIII